MRQWDIQQQAFKTSRLIRHQEYGTFSSHRGNISGRPSPSNSTPITVHQATDRRRKCLFLFNWIELISFDLESQSNPQKIQSSKASKQLPSH